MARSKRKKRASVGILFWIAFVLFVAVVFLYNKQNIENVLETTGLVEVLSERVGLSDDDEPEVTREDGEQAPDVDDDGRQPVPEDEPELEPVEPPVEETPPRQPESEPEPEPAEEPTPESRDEPEVAADPEAPPREPEERDEPEVQPRRRTSRIYYIRVTEDGTIYPHQVERMVSYVNSPMTQTLNALLKGPTTEELNLGLLNLIPENTQLISAAVEDGVAYLNFNESFRFNPMGVEGFVAQLQQIIYSTTEFPTVDRVQILIEGKRVDYLGGEGIYIGDPIGRNTFG
ncbi:MAG: GerMN domain-containing protein [Spirochaetia bacterium]